MGERTTKSWQSVPHFYLRREVDASRLESWRGVARATPGQERLSHTDLLVKIAAEALRRHPRVNSSWRDGAIVTSPLIGVGIAVAVDDGLVVPVLRDADRLPLAEIVARRVELVEAARAGRLRPDDLTGGTFTVSNLGMYGVDSFDAIINAPQLAILTVGRIADRIVPVDGQPALRPMMQLSVAFDHRAVDGARGARVPPDAGFVRRRAGGNDALSDRRSRRAAQVRLAVVSVRVRGRSSSRSVTPPQGKELATVDMPGATVRPSHHRYVSRQLRSSSLRCCSVQVPMRCIAC